MVSEIAAPGTSETVAQSRARPGAERRATVRIGGLLGVLGVVYGDIGTSPLYALQSSLRHFPTGSAGPREVLGILSLIFWALILIVTVKYVVLVMRADNRGEGGTLALMALAQRVAAGPRARAALALVGITGACLFFGDGVITPAISVLSAVEGLEVATPQLAHVVLPIAAAVIAALFAVQFHGTARVGRVFGPVMACWFLLLGVLGLAEILRHPSVLLAVSPGYAVALCLHYRLLAFVVLGSVVLCVTGVEALYADMGHFGALPIRLTWLCFVLPCLVLNYFGQGALVLADPTAAENPFYLLTPDWLRLPMVFIATLATVIASQALISGAYSVARQCMQLGFLPRMTLRHTSTTEEGQIYVPQVNAALALGVLALVFAFRSSANLASAYGVAVTGTFLCDCVLAAVVFRRLFHWSRTAAIGVFGGFFVVDLLFFSSNLLKLPEGGWVPLVLGTSLLALMTSWKRGRDLLQARWRADSLLLTLVPRPPPAQPHHPRARHGRVHDRQPRLRARRAAAQSEAQQGAARARPVRDRAQCRPAGNGRRRAHRSHRTGARHPPRAGAVRVHGKSEPAPRAGGTAQSGGGLRPDAGELLPGPRNPGSRQRAANAALADVPVPADGTQCHPGGRVLPHPRRPGGRTRGADHDLTGYGPDVISPCVRRSRDRSRAARRRRSPPRAGSRD